MVLQIPIDTINNMITATNLSKSFSGEKLFSDVSLKLGNSRKVALVGKNGCGKSTLLKIIAGELEYDTGNLVKEHDVIGYIPQELTFNEELVGELLEKQLDAAWDFYKVEQMVNEIHFTNFDPYQSINSLSEGQKMKLKLLQILLTNPTVLMVDEPTNHLDIEGIMWFEQFIKATDKTVLMISHDREFLNQTADEIWEIDNHKLLRFVGNYDNYREEKLKLIDKWNEEYVRFVKKKAQLEALLDRARTMNISRKGGTQQVKTRIRREIEENTKEKYINKKMQPLQFDSGVSHSKLMVRFSSVTKTYQKSPVFEDLSFEVRGGEKIWLFGPNGGGKSTIVKLIVGDEKPSNGIVKIGDNLKVGYFAQKQTYLDYSENLMDYFMLQTGCKFEEVFGKLKKFMFEKDDLKKKIGNLSPGQRARYAFAVFAYNNYDMLILDEPDNHLDIETKEVLENSLRDYRGTLLLISHDRYFVERVEINKLLYLKNGSLEQLDI